MRLFRSLTHPTPPLLCFFIWLVALIASDYLTSVPDQLANMAAPREWGVKKWGVADKSSVPFAISEIYYPTANKIDAVLQKYYDLRIDLHDDMLKALKRCEEGVEAIKECKKEYDAILEEMATVHNLPNRAQRISESRPWLVYWDTPDYWIDNDTGLRMEIKPGPKHKWHNEWRERLMTAEAIYGPHGLPPYPPFHILPHWVGRDHPQPLYIAQHQEQQQEQQQEPQQQQQQQEQAQQEQQAGSEEAGPSRPPPQSVANPEEVASSLSGSPSALNASSSAHLPGQPSAPEHARSSTPGPSDTNTRPTKLDKGKGKAVDTPNSNTTTATAGTIGSSSTAVGSPSSSAAVPISASASAVAGPSNTGNDTIVDTTKTTDNNSNVTNNNNNNSTITATVSKEESNQDVIANNAKDKSIANVQSRATKIKIVNPANKKDLKGKAKAVDKPSNTNNNNNNNHKIIKPSGSEHPAAVAKRQTIKRSQVFKEKDWVFKLDSSMFTDKGRIKREFLSGKGKGKATASGSANDNDNDGRKDNGEGSSKSTATTPINYDNGNNEDDNTSDDELALDAKSDNSDNFDSGSETDDSKDSNFTLTLKSKKRKAAAAAANTVTTAASASSSSSNKRKRRTADTGDEPEAGDEPEDPNAYYVLRCAFGEVCTTDTPYTHNAPANITGIFARHPFKKRRAWEHFIDCKLRKTYKSEKEIWKNCCRRVLPERNTRPVDDAWAKRHNRGLIKALVKQAGGGKKEKEMMEKEMEEEL